uniref:Uncharacterized protein n=1 Tax=bacterium enrichment culture clone 1(2010) TaxID=795322 RepID=D9CGI5_9BACT|nr:hypothetical protein pHB1_gp02 [bacterium enrichment culture clone 1(2010)]
MRDKDVEVRMNSISTYRDLESLELAYRSGLLVDLGHALIKQPVSRLQSSHRYSPIDVITMGQRQRNQAPALAMFLQSRKKRTTKPTPIASDCRTSTHLASPIATADEMP